MMIVLCKFDVSASWIASAPGEKHRAGCPQRTVAIQVPVHVPGCSSSVLWICPQTERSPHHHHLTKNNVFSNGSGTATIARRNFIQHVPGFFSVLTLLLDHVQGLKGPQFRSPSGPPPWHTWAAIRCRFAALQSPDWGTRRLAWSQWNWQWCLLQLANDIGSSWAQIWKVSAQVNVLHLNNRVAKRVLAQIKRNVESSAHI